MLRELAIDEHYEKSLVTFYRGDPKNPIVVGGGVFISPSLVLTCTHILEDLVDKEQREFFTQVFSRETIQQNLEFSFLGKYRENSPQSRPVKACLIYSWPSQPSEKYELDILDIAVLEVLSKEDYNNHYRELCQRGIRPFREKLPFTYIVGISVYGTQNRSLRLTKDANDGYFDTLRLTTQDRITKGHSGFPIWVEGYPYTIGGLMCHFVEPLTYERQVVSMLASRTLRKAERIVNAAHLKINSNVQSDLIIARPHWLIE